VPPFVRWSVRASGYEAFFSCSVANLLLVALVLQLLLVLVALWCG